MRNQLRIFFYREAIIRTFFVTKKAAEYWAVRVVWMRALANSDGGVYKLFMIVVTT